jgi:hypothetical protein
VGPRFSGKVREEPQCRERDTGEENCETGMSKPIREFTARIERSSSI